MAFLDETGLAHFWNHILARLNKFVPAEAGKGLSSNDYTTTEKTKLSGIAEGAEVNQNAFSNVVVGSTTVAADSPTDTLTLEAGANITLTPDATNDKITIKANIPVATSTALGGVKSGTDITVDSKGNVSVKDDSHNHIISNIDGLQDTLNAKVPTSRTVNGKALSSDIVLSASDVSARPNTWTPSASDVGALPLSGGTLTGNLTGKYITGTWLQSTANNHLGSKPPKVCVQDASGWVYHRTAEELRDDIGAAPASHTSNTIVHITADERAAWNSKADAPFKPEGKSYLTFSSPNSFTLKVNDTTKHWDGTLEYFASDKTWTAWDGTTTLTAINNDGEYVLYLRGSGNTVIAGSSASYRWVLTGSDIACIGNIETLLDYATVASGEHPRMLNYCYEYMFYGCTSLTKAPSLPATTLAPYCYSEMFYNCTSLTQAPALPATTLAPYCYYSMFEGCTALIQAPALPATTLADSCYKSMFYNCTNLKLSSTQTGEYTQEYHIPSSGTGTTADNALSNMFTFTGGTFTGTPKINTTYYLSSDNMVIRETEIATLNGYVGSMIRSAYTYGTEDLVAGTSELATGTLYFVYE